jgi:hypothetical protein
MEMRQEMGGLDRLPIQVRTWKLIILSEENTCTEDKQKNDC